MIEFVIMTLGGLAGGAAYLMWRRRATWLSRIPATPIAEFPTADPAKSVGVVALHQALTEAPLSVRQCVCFSVMVEELRGGGTQLRWVSRGAWSGGVPFLLSDDSGTAFVEPRHGVFALAPDYDSKSNPIYAPGEREQAVLDRLGLQAKRAIRYYRQFRFWEAIVEVGDTVAVYAAPTPSELEPNASTVAGSYRDGPATRLTLQSTRTHKLVVSSLDRDIGR